MYNETMYFPSEGRIEEMTISSMMYREEIRQSPYIERQKSEDAKNIEHVKKADITKLLCR